MLGPDPARSLPTHYGTGINTKLSTHGSNAAESSKDVRGDVHDSECVLNPHVSSIHTAHGAVCFFHAKRGVEPAATRLKRLRLAASPPISIRRMAELLELDHSTYVRYERPERFKKKHLPLDLARRLAPILADHGVSQDDVLALAGVEEGELGQPALSAGEEHWLDIYRDLSAGQRKLLIQLADEMRTPTAPTIDPTLHTPTREYRAHTD